MDNITMKRPKIDSLQAIRGIAFIGVFLSHTGIKCFDGIGAWGVSIFLILSGFVMIYSYLYMGKIKKIDVFHNIQFAWNKIMHLYFLHLLTTLGIVLLHYVFHYQDTKTNLLIKEILNILLIQEWIPFSERSLNSVSWFLSVILFCYFLFPWILKHIERRGSRKTAIRAIILLFLLQIFLCGIFSIIPSPKYSVNSWINVDFTQWLIYFFPLTRSIDFIIGCCVGYLFVTREKKRDLVEQNQKLLSRVAIILVIVANILYVYVKNLPSTEDITLISHPERWWIYTVIYTLSSCLIIYLLAIENTDIAKLITKRIIIYLGNISQYAFLIHTVVFTYLLKALIIFIGLDPALLYLPWVEISAGSILTLLATKIWLLIIHKKVKF